MAESYPERKHCGKRIAGYEQFLLFPQCFQNACFPGASKGVIVWEWVKEVVQKDINHCLRKKNVKSLQAYFDF